MSALPIRRAFTPVVIRPDMLGSRNFITQPDSVPTTAAAVEQDLQRTGTFVDFASFERDIVAKGGPKARRSYEGWLAKADRDPIYADVHSFVHDFSHEALYDLKLEDVEAITSSRDPAVRTDHALSDIDPKLECIKEVDNFDTPWSLFHLQHALLERRGRLYRWSEFDRFLRGPAKARYYDVFRRRFGYDERSPDEIHRLERALQWRIGNGYYSFLREVDLLTRLRVVHGLPVRYHVLADTLYRIDLWCENVLVAVYVKNSKYRSGREGRKLRTKDFMDVTGFKLLELELEVPFRRGVPSLVTPADVQRAAEAIKTALAEKDRGDA